MHALLICGKRSHTGLLNSIMAGLRSPAPIGVDCICNKARLVSWLLSVHSLLCILQIWCMLLLVHYFGGDMMMLWIVGCLVFCRILWMFLMWSLFCHQKQFILAVHTLQMSSWMPTLGPALTGLPSFFYNWELTVIIYNTNKVVINHQYVNTNYLPGFVWYIIV